MSQSETTEILAKKLARLHGHDIDMWKTYAMMNEADLNQLIEWVEQEKSAELKTEENTKEDIKVVAKLNTTAKTKLKSETKEVLAKKLTALTGQSDDMWKIHARMLKADLIMLLAWAESEGKDGLDLRQKIDRAIDDKKAKDSEKQWAKIEAKNEEYRKSQSVFYGLDLAPIIIPILVVLFFIFLIVKCTYDAYNKPYYTPGVPYGNEAVENVRKALKREGY